MRARWAQLRWQLRRIPGRTKLGLAIAAVAIAGLVWQHYTGSDTPAAQGGQSSVEATDEHAGGDHGHDHGSDGHAHGEYQPDPSTMAPPPDFSPDAARVTASRFASNFASPNGNHDDWLARITPDVMPELLDQYRLTDIRNIPQTAVAQVNGPIGSNPAVPTYQVSYADGSRIEATLEMDSTGWKVSSVVPVDAPASDVPAPTPAAATPVNEVG